MAETETARAEVGAPAPDFTLPAGGGRAVSLRDLRGKAVVLYLYPKDDTSGCTKEAIGFSEKAGEFAAAGAVVLGLSRDPVASHDRFIAKHGLNLVLLSDETGAVARPMAPGWRSRCTAGSIWASTVRPS